MNQQTQDLLEKDRKYIWHSMSPYNEKATPLVIEEAQGAWVTDIDNNKYLDAMSGLWCVNIGYGRTELAEAAYEQLKTLAYFPLTQSHRPAIDLAEKLNQWLGDEYRIFYSNSGSEANEAAFKIARQYHIQNGNHGRYKFIARYRAYHGHSMGSLAATGQAQRKYKYEPLAPGFLHVPPPDCYRCPFGKTPDSCQLECAQTFDDTINWEWPDTVAGVIMEPVITGGGVLVPHPEYMKKVQDICRKYGVLFMVDEVICGFGRTGEKFGFQHYGVKPDIITMAKGITSAYLPLSVTAVRQDLFDVFKDTEETAHLRHINTFGGNPAACALAIKNLEIIEEEQLIERAAELGQRLRSGLAELEDHPNVGDIRSLGFLLGVELVEDKQTKEPASAAKVGQVIAECKRNGLIIGRNGDTVKGYNNVLTLSPPFTVTDDDLEFIITTFKQAIRNLV